MVVVVTATFVGPLVGLPSFVKKLAVTGGPHTWQVLASNFRNRRWRVPVHPANEPYRWAAPGHEDLLADEARIERGGIGADVNAARRNQSTLERTVG